MADNSTTPEYAELVGISNSMHADYLQENHRWEGSPFAWIKTRPSRSIGAIGEKMVASWLALHDFNVQRSPDSQADRIVEGKRVEIKFSTLWENGQYVFQQIRDQNYDFMILLGLSPFDAHCWVVPKSVLMDMRMSGALVGQHTGKSGGDTAWAHLDPENTVPGFADYGNSLRKALASVSRLTGFTPNSLTKAFDG